MQKSHSYKPEISAMLGGYRHHPYELEKELFDYIFKGKGTEIISNELTLETYANILAPERLRAMKNSIICAVTLISRKAIEYGVDAELSFTMSDHYINEVEIKTNKQQLEELLFEIIAHYSELVRNDQHSTYSLHVTRAIRYIHQHIFGPCRVHDVAKYVNLNPQYFAGLFKSEVGITPIEYIRKKKMEQARDLLMQANSTVTEIADMLGYCNASHFILEFKKAHGITPNQFRKPK